MNIFRRFYYKIFNPLANQLKNLLINDIADRLTLQENKLRTALQDEVGNKLANLEEQLRNRLVSEMENKQIDLINELERIQGLLTELELKLSDHQVLIEHSIEREGARRFEELLEEFKNHVSNIYQHISDSELSIKINTIQAINNKSFREIKATKEFKNVFSLNEEYNIFKYITIEKLVSYIGDDSNKITLISLWADLYKNYFKNINFIEPVSNDNLLSLRDNNYRNDVTLCFPTALPKIINNQSKIVVVNTHFSNFLLNNEVIIETLSEKIRDTLILPVIIYTSPLIINWEYGFSDNEENEGVFFRWCEGEEREALITLYSNHHEPLDRVIEWTSYALSNECPFIQVKGCGLNKVFNLNQQSKIVEQIILNPGVNRLSFNFLGKTVKPEGGARLLNFNIIDMRIHPIDESEVHLSGIEVYKNDSIYLSDYLNDYMIRKKLHLNGFFEVSANAYLNSGNVIKKLPTTRYFHDTNNFYNLDTIWNDTMEEIYNDGIEQLLVVYTANRSGRVRKNRETK